MRSIILAISLVLIFSLLVVAKPRRLLIPTDEDTEPESTTIPSVHERKLITPKPTYRSILRENNRLSLDELSRTHFRGDTLGYVTPWNGKGYDVAVTFRNKFTYISPVWYQLVRKATKIVLEGTHNVDKNWISQVRPANETETAPKIVPRVVLDGWRAEEYVQLMKSHALADTLIQTIVAEASNQQYQGLVLDMGGLIGIRVAIDDMYRFVKTFAQQLHDKNMELLLVLPPYRGSQNEITSKDYEELAEYVDRFSLMTYDYSNRAGPNAPERWLLGCTLHLISLDTARSKPWLADKLLLGLNWYGYDYTMPSGTGEAITGDKYLELLEEHHPTIQWDADAQEPLTKYRSGNEHVIYYPSLESINRRLDLANQLGVGVSIWELGQGLEYFHELL